jgi:NAD(P)-dependent dehydrogenase (short-subunit alcohol dehydrogenase family)
MHRKLTAVVTGASNGIGAGIARHLLAAGATVINIDIHKPARPPRRRYRYHAADLSDPEATAAVAERIAHDFDVNCLVNNAGYPTPGVLERVGVRDFDHGVNLHMRAALLLAQAVVPAMKAGRFGRIVNISSRAILGKPARTVYSATKAALVGYTRTWALELAPHGITVNAIAPGPVITELFRKNNPPAVAKRLVASCLVGRAGTPDDIARAAMFFASPDNGFVTGQVLHVCGGTSMVVNW